MEEIDMTNKVKTTTDTVLSKAEVLLRDLEAASRGRRLRKAEAEIKDAAKPKTLGGRGVALQHAEAEVASRQRPDPRCMWRGMTTK
jgi:hypothetical protein